ncbi:MAG: hypothetical protein WCF04_00980 [Candidatus Nanopelagicales bacterium]
MSKAGIYASGLVGGGVGSVGRAASAATEKVILVSGTSVATGVGVAIDALAAPFRSRSEAQPAADPGARAA